MASFGRLNKSRQSNERDAAPATDDRDQKDGVSHREKPDGYFEKSWAGQRQVGASGRNRQRGYVDGCS